MTAFSCHITTQMQHESVLEPTRLGLLLIISKGPSGWRSSCIAPSSSQKDLETCQIGIRSVFTHPQYFKAGTLGEKVSLLALKALPYIAEWKTSVPLPPRTGIPFCRSARSERQRVKHVLHTRAFGLELPKMPSWCGYHRHCSTRNKTTMFNGFKSNISFGKYQH